MEASVSISITSAIVYIISGLVFFGLVFLLVMMGVTNCNWSCCNRWSYFSKLIFIQCLNSKYYVKDDLEVPVE